MRLFSSVYIAIARASKRHFKNNRVVAAKFTQDLKMLDKKISVAFAFYCLSLHLDTTLGKPFIGEYTINAINIILFLFNFII